jgi:hypothetical protein
MSIHENRPPTGIKAPADMVQMTMSMNNSIDFSAAYPFRLQVPDQVSSSGHESTSTAGIYEYFLFSGIDE